MSKENEVKDTTKAMPYDALLRAGRLPESLTETTMFEMSANYLQKGDSCTKNEINELKIETQDGGDGAYYVISTERFAFDKPEELIEILNDFVRRFSPCT